MEDSPPSFYPPAFLDHGSVGSTSMSMSMSGVERETSLGAAAHPFLASPKQSSFPQPAQQRQQTGELWSPDADAPLFSPSPDESLGLSVAPHATTHPTGGSMGQRAFLHKGDGESLALPPLLATPSLGLSSFPIPMPATNNEQHTNGMQSGMQSGEAQYETLQLPTNTGMTITHPPYEQNYATPSIPYPQAQYDGGMPAESYSHSSMYVAPAPSSSPVLSHHSNSSTSSNSSSGSESNQSRARKLKRMRVEDASGWEVNGVEGGVHEEQVVHHHHHHQYGANVHPNTSYSHHQQSNLAPPPAIQSMQTSTQSAPISHYVDTFHHPTHHSHPSHAYTHQGNPTNPPHTHSHTHTHPRSSTPLAFPPSSMPSNMSVHSGAISPAPNSRVMNMQDHSQSNPHAPVTVRRDGLDSSPNGVSDDASTADDVKKLKHQLTDRQRRAKIKEGMDALKSLVPLEPNQKADQATIVASSVTLVRDLKDEVRELREKLKQMEIEKREQESKYETKKYALTHHHTGTSQPGRSGSSLSTAPLSSLMASLNGAGVSMWRIGTSGEMLEVNLVFELISGFSAAEVVGQSPCSAPLHGSLSVIPSAFMQSFSQAPAAVTPRLLEGGEVEENTTFGRSPSQSANQHSNHNTPSPPNSPTCNSSASGASSAGSCTSTPTPLQTNPSVTASTSSVGSSSNSPAYGTASISHVPIVPQTELRSFFPVECRTLLELDVVKNEDGEGDEDGHGNRSSSRRNDPIVHPQPRGSFLINHLAAMPNGHVLKLLGRHLTMWGEILECIVTICLVRDEHGQPDYILCLTTPDSRRLLSIQDAQNYMQHRKHH